ncbi:MAG: TolC family protein [Phycisphaerae bacterium]
MKNNHIDKIKRYGGAALGAILLTGCASVPRQGGFKSVAALSKQRTGATVIWDQNTKADQRVHAAVRKLLKHPLTARSAVQIALLNNPELQAHYEQLGVSQADLVQAGLLSNPVFNFDIRFPAAPFHGWDASIAQNFLDILLLPARKKIAAAQFAAAKSEVANAVITLAQRTRAAYYRLVGDQQMVHLERTIKQAAAAQVDLAKKLRQAGNSPPIAYDQQLTLYEHVRLQLAMDKATVLEDHERLNALIGLWGKEGNWTVPSSLAIPPTHDLSLKGLESVALKQSLSLVAARQHLRADAIALRISGIAGLLPGAGIGLNYVRDPDVRGTLGPAISLPIPIFNQGQPQVAIAEAQYRAAYRSYQAAAIRIRAKVREAWIATHAAHQEVLFYQRIMLPLRKRMVDETQLAYNGMYVSGFVLMQAKQAEIDTARHYVQTLQQYWLARQQLRQVLGGLLPAQTDGTNKTSPTSSHKEK